MKKAHVFIDYDMLIRHFVLAGAFRELEKRYDVTYVIQADPTTDKTVINVDVNQLGLKRVILFEVPRKRMGAWDKIYCITALANQRGTRNYNHRRKLIADVRGWPRTRYYELLSQTGIFPLVKRRLLRELGTYAPLREFLSAERPDIVIHPSILAGYFINELAQICPEMGIPFVVLMNSWDNPSTKAMSAGLPDRLVVWGPQTRRHAIEFMKMPQDRVLEFGAAQFEVYRQPPTESERELRADFGVPNQLPVVLYAGVSKSVNETEHLMAIDAAIADGRIPPCHIIYRPHPWRGGLVNGELGFFDVPFRHVTMDPFMADYYRRVALAPERGFDMADYRVTARLLRLVCGVISPLSTILLEAVMHGLPVIMFYPAGGHDDAANTIRLGRQLPHFAEFWGPKGIDICLRADDLPAAFRALLTEHQAVPVRDALRAHARGYVTMDGPPYSVRLAELADELTTAKRSIGSSREAKRIVSAPAHVATVSAADH